MDFATLFKDLGPVGGFLVVMIHLFIRSDKKYTNLETMHREERKEDRKEQREERKETTQAIRELSRVIADINKKS